MSHTDQFVDETVGSPEDMVWLVNDLGATIWISTREGGTLEVRRRFESLFVPECVLTT